MRPTMGKLFDTIRRLVANEEYLVGEHASERLEERGIVAWQADGRTGRWRAHG